MEKRDLGKAEALQTAALLKDVQGLKDALEAKNLKEQIIANIMLVEDKKLLEKAAKAVGNAIFPKKPIDVGGATPEQGNG